MKGNRNAATKTPHARATTKNTICFFDTDLGPIATVETPNGLAAVVLEARRGSDRADGFARKYGCEEVRKSAVAAKIARYASGEMISFHDVQLDVGSMTEFQQAVMKACRGVGYGETISYGELARRSGSPRAYRAVGNIMAANRWPIVVPCHRVIHGSGGLGGYSGPTGTCMKERLLAIEGVIPSPEHSEALSVRT